MSFSTLRMTVYLHKFYRCEADTGWGRRPEGEVAARCWSEIRSCCKSLCHKREHKTVGLKDICLDALHVLTYNLDKIWWWYFRNTLRNIFFLKVCQLERFGETSGLGISLEARAGHHYLCSILPEGPVGQSGNIFLGDQILEVTDR